MFRKLKPAGDATCVFFAKMFSQTNFLLQYFSDSPATLQNTRRSPFQANANVHHRMNVWDSALHKSRFQTTFDTKLKV